MFDLVYVCVCTEMCVCSIYVCLFMRVCARLCSSVFMRCQLNRLNRGQMIDEWFPLSSHIPLKGIEPGSLRVRARYAMEKIMPEEEYSEFKEVPPQQAASDSITPDNPPPASSSRMKGSTLDDV